MSEQLMVFVSHAPEDVAFCRELVDGLRGAGADVWCDDVNASERPLEPAEHMIVIHRELGRRPIVVVVLSQEAFASSWVRRAVTWASDMLDLDPTRLILPVTGGPIERVDFDPERSWSFLQAFPRIEAPDLRPYPPHEAARRLMHALALTPACTAPIPAATADPQPFESADDLLTRGKALAAQSKYAEAVPLLARATQLTPHSFDAWFNIGLTLYHLNRDNEALLAYERATALKPTSEAAWNNEADTYNFLGRYQDALTAIKAALVLDPHDAFAWGTQGRALEGLMRYGEALAAYDRALALRPIYPYALKGKARVLRALRRTTAAKAAEHRAKEVSTY